VLLADHLKEATESTVLRLHSSLEKVNQEANRGYDISFSYGVVEFDPERHSAIETLLEDGDKLMYQSKKSGR
jgi:PleD family two-component response regulator